jgi:serine/threonine protein kinase
MWNTPYPGAASGGSADSLPGTLLPERYDVVRCLGEGAFGSVYLCRDWELAGTMVAVKVFSPSVRKLPGGAAQLAQEMLSAYQVRHDNVVHFYDLIQSDDALAMVMEYVAGPQLAALIDPVNPCSVARVLELLQQICSGLEAIHALGLQHRSLKPENILLSEERVVKITDFAVGSLTEWYLFGGLGLTVRKLDPHELHCNPQIARLAGTLEYASPEAIQGAACDTRSDIYSMGVIAYELITGQRLYSGDDPMALLALKLERPPEQPRRKNLACPEALNDFCMKAMERDPARRHQTARECVYALREMARGVAVRTSGRHALNAGFQTEITRTPCIDAAQASRRLRSSVFAVQNQRPHPSSSSFASAAIPGPDRRLADALELALGFLRLVIVLITCVAAMVSTLYLCPIPDGTVPPGVERVVDQVDAMIRDLSTRYGGDE